jgi:hypothetical protein
MSKVNPWLGFRPTNAVHRGTMSSINNQLRHSGSGRITPPSSFNPNSATDRARMQLAARRSHY